MPGFADKLSPEQIKQLADYIYAPLPRMPVWDMEQIERPEWCTTPTAPCLRAGVRRRPAEPVRRGRSRRPSRDHPRRRSAASRSSASPRATRCTADRSSRPTAATSTSPRATAGSPSTTCGTSTMVAEVRAGINTRNAAVSGDGRTSMVGNYLPHTLVVLDARDLTPVKIIAVRRRERQDLARVARCTTPAPRAQLRRRAQGHPRAVGDLLRPERPSRCTTAWSTTTSSARASPRRASSRPRRTRLDEYPGRLLLRPELRVRRSAPRATAARGRWSISTCGARSPTCRSARLAAPRLGHQLGAGRAHRDGHAQPQAGRGERDRHEDLEAGQADRHARARASSCAATRTRPTPGSTRSTARTRTRCR